MDYLYHPDKDKCLSAVSVRDTYRYSGRGSGGFSLHYTIKQCSRKPGVSGYCWQHAPKERRPTKRALDGGKRGAKKEEGEWVRFKKYVESETARRK